MASFLLDSLFSGAKAFAREMVEIAREAVHVILDEIDRSAIGQAATQLVKGVTSRYFSAARDLAEEEAELAAKFQKDRRRNEADEERLREIERQRERLRKDLDAAKAREAADELRRSEDAVVSAPVTDDEASASAGILASKQCPTCGGTMRIRLGAYNAGTQRQSFYWQCTAPNRAACPTLKLDPTAEQKSVIRPPDPDLDGPAGDRRKTWNHPDVLVKTHARVRAALEEEDEEVVCPDHLTPMKLVHKRSGTGRLLDNYEYVCLGVTREGLACRHTVPIKTFPQVSAALRRREGKGIIDG